jgi:hypothetical protein
MFNTGFTSVSDAMSVSVCEATKSLLHNCFRKCRRKSFVIEAHTEDICDTWPQKLKYQALMLPVRTFDIKVIQQLHYMPRTDFFRVEPR